MNPQQAFQLLEEFRQKAVIPGGTGRDYDMVRAALAAIAQAIEPKKGDKHDPVTQ